MFRRHSEIWIALIAIVAVTAVYVLAYLQAGAFPAASGLVGHGIGILGLALMLATETLYSLRKRSTEARWGSMANWLRFHMVTGIVGPYMVLLHTSMKFQGLAGVAMLLTLVVVVSGLVGRYIYTTVPRVVERATPEPIVAGAPAADVQVPAAEDPVPREGVESLEARRRALASWYSVHIPLTWALFVTAFVHAGAALYYATLQR